MYVAKFDGTVYVLHCFQKKTQKPAKRICIRPRGVTGIC